ncbi:MAG TPA: hypothetical protein VHC69_02685 [Polyangiaceae bacterium]|nr:hypothetical protein [Polyangiaceae bacterium]
MNTSTRLIFSLSVFGTLVAASGAYADAPPPPHGPPKEAVDACVNRAEGDSCTVTFGERSVNGTCEKAPSGELACRPNGPPPPPPEAFEACAKASAGDACTVTFHEHTLNGTCERFPGESALACRPSSPPPAPTN